jgi:hypothetical protein
MPWPGDIAIKDRIIKEAKEIFTYESPFIDYEEIEKNPSLIDKFSFKGIDKLNLGLNEIDTIMIDNIIKKYIDEWNPSNENEKYSFTKNPKYNMSYPEFDAFILYAFIRHYKPNKIVEIGSGSSTKVMIEALIKNNNGCKLFCIEPYNDISHLVDIYPINIIKDKVENLDINFFSDLTANDILFIDSTHVLKPYGDVEYEYLHILPLLKNQCLVHIHDIFYPYDYPKGWLIDWKCTLTEQQFLIAFLYGNSHWKCISANNYLLINNEHIIPEKIQYKCGGSFWIQKMT